MQIYRIRSRELCAAATIVTLVISVTALLQNHHLYPETFKQETVTYTYSWDDKKGLPFQVDKSALSAIGFPLTDFIEVGKSTFEDFVFVMALSRLYATSALDTIATIQKHFPTKKIILYDIGLDPEMITQFRSLCNVEFRTFSFAPFPDHVKANLKNYAWKLIIIHEVLQHYTGVFWTDSSIKFLTNINSSGNSFTKVKQTHGIAFYPQPKHSNFAVIMNETVRYLVTDLDRQKDTLQSGSGLVLIYRTREVYENIIKWAVLCSLQQDCIAHGHLKCDWQVGNHKWAHCSRFDQSVLNILSSNYLGFDNGKYTTHYDKSFTVRRTSFANNWPEYCSLNPMSSLLDKFSRMM